ncbi:MAG: amidohydrolase family protein [Halieaceae bacterium]|jgi:cytosine deaminase|nr:amidohydrolase family protein [Halieaceae bacterium]
MQLDTLITGARTADSDQRLALGIAGDRIVYLNSAEDSRGRDFDCQVTVDAADCLLLPGLIEPHAHLDKTYSVAALPSGPASDQGALRDAIDAMARHKSQRSIEDMQRRASNALDRAIACGVSLLRTHVDIGVAEDLDNLRALLDLKRARRDSIELRLTVLSDPATPEGFALSKQALELGADAIGGAPALTNDPQAGIDACFTLAEQHGADIDLHIDENEDPDSPCLAYLADQVLKRNWQGRVSASHCCSLAFVPAERRRDIVARVRDANIDVVALPACNLFLMGRNQQPTPRGIAPVNDLQAAGVNVSVGTDNVQDPFHPMGDYDPLANAALLLDAGHFGGGEVLRALDMTTYNAARALGLEPDYGLRQGALASFSLYACETPLQALTERPLRRQVFYRGRTVLKQRTEQQWMDGLEH